MLDSHLPCHLPFTLKASQSSKKKISEAKTAARGLQCQNICTAVCSYIVQRITDTQLVNEQYKTARFCTRPLGQTAIRLTKSFPV
jgi:hypothetical protein